MNGDVKTVGQAAVGQTAAGQTAAGQTKAEHFNCRLEHILL